MTELPHLHTFELVPVIELEAFLFDGHALVSPTKTGPEDPQAWDDYWRAALATGGVTGVPNVRTGSWNAVAASLTDPGTLAHILRVLIDNRGGPETLYDADQQWSLDGGFALVSREPQAVIEPTCCTDLTDGSSWFDAAGYRGAGWTMVWIGHPWISVRYVAPRLVLSQQHESAEPVDTWTVDPDRLRAAAAEATASLEPFAPRIAGALDLLGLPRDRDLVARRLAGLP